MARAPGSKVYLYFMKKGRQARPRISRNLRFCLALKCTLDINVLNDK